MLGAEGVPQIGIFEHEMELSRLKLHEIPIWFPSNILIASWKYHPESTRLRNLNGFRVGRTGEVLGQQEGLEQAGYL